MPKLLNKRILMEWNDEIFYDSTVGISIDRLCFMSDSDGAYLYNGDTKYRLMFPVAHYKNLRYRKASYLEELNQETGLMHQYKSLSGCRLYLDKKLLSKNITLIVFNCTLDEKPEYSDCSCSNWNFNPVWGYSSEVVSVLYRHADYQI